MEWQPIETAPKDGTKILAWCRHGEIELTHWYQNFGFEYEEVGDGLYRRVKKLWSEGWNGNSFTHWLPLPPAPAVALEPAKTNERG